MPSQFAECQLGCCALPGAGPGAGQEGGWLWRGGRPEPGTSHPLGLEIPAPTISPEREVELGSQEGLVAPLRAGQEAAFQNALGGLPRGSSM